MIYVEDGLIKLNGVILPGLVKNIEVTETAQIDEQEVDGSAAKPKQAVGYEDAKISIELIIDDTEEKTKYENLSAIRTLFRQPTQSVPQPIPIICEDTTTHGIDKVLFKSLSHKAENKKEQLTVTIELYEYIPCTITVTKSASKSSSKSSSAKSKTSSSSSSSNSLTAGYKSYLATGRGASPALLTVGNPTSALTKKAQSILNS